MWEHCAKSEKHPSSGLELLMGWTPALGVLLSVNNKTLPNRALTDLRCADPQYSLAHHGLARVL